MFWRTNKKKQEKVVASVEKMLDADKGCSPLTLDDIDEAIKVMKEWRSGNQSLVMSLEVKKILDNFNRP